MGELGGFDHRFRKGGGVPLRRVRPTMSQGNYVDDAQSHINVNTSNNLAYAGTTDSFTILFIVDA
jgi:hypothetical protein